MKVLIYNFVQPDELGKQGGGVAVYQRNLVQNLSKAGHEVISMSSGDRYSVVKREPYLKTESHSGSSGLVNRVYLYNSPVYAPAHYAFYDLDTYCNSKSIDKIPEELKRLFGAIDVFHFQNIEGLTASFFRRVKEAFPESRLVLSAHNYNIVCPQVNLWFRETMSCVDYREGFACVNCIGGLGANPQELNVRRMDTILSYLGVRRHSRLSGTIEFAARIPFRLKRVLRRWAARSPTKSASDPVGRGKTLTVVSPDMASSYKHFRTTNIELCRTVFDHVVAVSARTRDVLVANGLARDRISVSYIGTAHHQRFLEARRKLTFGPRLHIAYLGYMRRDKGFFFFMECLQLIPEHLAANMVVTIAAPYDNDWPVKQLRGIAHKYAGLHLNNGYTHGTIDTILEDVDLGIVPVLWEDNLPQVAIEIVARGIPILASDKGGASEIASRPEFIFRSGSKHDFLRKLEQIASKEIPLSNFWEGEHRVFSMEQHVTDLMQYYRGPPSPVSGEPVSRSAELTFEG